MLQTQQGTGPQKTTQQIERKYFQIFVVTLYNAGFYFTENHRESEAIPSTVNPELRAQSSTLGTIIKPLPSFRAGGTKQGTGILAGHNGKSSQRMAGIKSRCLPAAALPTQHCLSLPIRKAPKHSISYTPTHLERPTNTMSANKKQDVSLTS